MKNMLIFISVVFIYSCGINKTVCSKTNSVNSKRKKLPSSYYLSNRIPDCRKAVQFMDEFIEPDSVKTNIFNYPKEFYPIASIYFSIKGDENIKKLEDIQYFYLDLNCLKSCDYKELFSIICSQKDFDIIEQEFNSERGQKGRYIFEVGIKNMNGFTIIVKNREIIEINWGVHKILY